MIREETVSVVIEYGEPGPEHTIEAVHAKGRASREDWRRLQPCSVSLFPHEFREHLGGDVEQIAQGIYRWRGVYDARKGISAEYSDPADLIT